ncbi:MAG: MFS transporter, partial [Chloroflexi bacterium]|nr:MFS transporter [Chloroflexota bacterium]
VFVPLVLFIIHVFGGGENGLRAAFWVTGIGGGVALAILVRLFYNEPADIGLRPLGASEDEPIRRVARGRTAQIRTKVFLKLAQRTNTFWNLIGIHFWGCAGHAIILAFLPSIIEDRGLGRSLAASTFIVLSVMSTITRFGVPVLADRIGSKGVMAACFILQSAPMILLFFAYEPWMFYLFAVLFGIGFGGEMTAFPIINRQYYGSAPIGTAYGWQMMGSGVGMALGAGIGGFLRNWTGNFDATILVSLTLSLIGVVAILLLPTTSHHLLPDWEEALPQEARSAG